MDRGVKLARHIGWRWAAGAGPPVSVTTATWSHRRVGDAPRRRQPRAAAKVASHLPIPALRINYEYHPGEVTVPATLPGSTLAPAPHTLMPPPVIAL